MKHVHQHLWDYFQAIRNSETMVEWLRIANNLLVQHGFDKQTTALDAQRMLKKINKFYSLV
jgi:hypothetical protein